MAAYSHRMVPEIFQTFWAAMAAGEFITDATAAAGTFTKQGSRWLTACGGVRPGRCFLQATHHAHVSAYDFAHVEAFDTATINAHRKSRIVGTDHADIRADEHAIAFADSIKYALLPGIAGR
ncbi:hypothetical protein R4P64_29325 [Rhodococcus sp. IEGM 1366]|uniref:hypothetical protein n=1 Tax=Rhodococcus sp. IEGM 1366 TaxID=3082223 RepID=UPI002952E63D|nr:hypothetical protein [Rhodococcus sp. IEGM 1366]MDV8070641.1 hypothetical protein [Rhodococcus sp. IEGM 1366]